VLGKRPEVQREFIRTQHLHAVASSCAKLPDDVFVSAATAHVCSMVNLVKLFMKRNCQPCCKITALACFIVLSCGSCVDAWRI